MNITAWLLAGTVIGWICFSHFRLNTKGGLPFSIIIGIAGGILGGELLAPWIETVPIHPGEFDPLSLFTASAVSLASVTFADMVHRRFGV